MSTTTQIPTRTTPSAPTPAAERQPVWKHGVASAVVASVATTVLAAIASAAATRITLHTVRGDRGSALARRLARADKGSNRATVLSSGRRHQSHPQGEPRLRW